MFSNKRRLAMEESVGLVIITRDNDSLKVLCQKRSHWSTERNAPSNFPGCLQVSCHGKLEDGENFYSSLIREMEQELGERFTTFYRNNVQPHKIVEIKNEKKHVITFAVYIENEQLKMIELGKEVGGLFYLSEKETDQILPIDPSMKEKGAPEGRNAMFQDEIDAIKKAFDEIKGMEHLKKVWEKCQ